MNIKELRKKYKITQRALCVKVGVSLTTLQNWELGGTTPNEENKIKLIKVFEELEKSNG